MDVALVRAVVDDELSSIWVNAKNPTAVLTSQQTNGRVPVSRNV